MEFEGEFSVSSSPADTWELLLDPDELCRCIPNCQEVDVIDETHYTVIIGVSISYISVTFETSVEIQERRPEEFLKVHLSGNAKSGDSRMEATGELTLLPRDDGGTDLTYTNTVEVTGRVMNMGSRIVNSVGQRQTEKTIENVQDALGRIDA